MIGLDLKFWLLEQPPTMKLKSSHSTKPSYWLIVIVFLSLSLVIVPTIGANDDTPTPEPTIETSTPTTETPAEVPTEATVTATETVSTPVTTTEPVQPTVEATQAVQRSAESGMDLQSMQTSCRLNIDDLADNNPFTYAFSAIGVNNIASYSWNFGDSGTATTQTATHTYATTGTFTISLTCTPTAGFGAPITLTGSITVSSTPVANFTLTPSNMMTGMPPFNIGTVNNSTGGGLTYSWKVSSSSNPADPGIYTATTQNISYSFPGYGVYWFHLVVTDGAGVTAGASQSVTFNAPPPQAQFTLTPADGTSPLNVTVTGTDMGAGPITSWSWDFGDGSAVVTGQGPHSHTYTLTDPAVAQSFFITLSYSGPGGSGTYTREVGVYPASEPVFAIFTSQSMGNVGGGVQYCFTNTSTGPVAQSRWDFDGNGTYDLTSNDAVVCHVYTVENTFIVRLQVQNATATSTSTASNAVSVFFSPVANFTVAPGMTITWGSTINLDSSSSTGTIVSYSWDFNGDGVEDSASPNPSGVLLTTLGNNTIRLTVTGPGGVSYVEKIVFVARATISCDFSGNLSVLPSAGAQAYNSNITNLMGRTVTSYAWTVTGIGAGLPMSFSTQNISVDWSSIGTGSFVVTLEATASDGASCSETKTVTRAWQPLNCQISDNLPATLYPNNTNYTFTANVSNLDSRPIVGYVWYVDGADQSNNAATFNRSWSVNPPSAYNEVVRYEVTVDNLDGTFSNCFEQRTVTINPYPTLACSMNSALPPTLYPNGNTYNFSTNINNLAGRPIQSYRWYVDGVDQSNNANNFNWTNITDSTLTPVSYTVRYEATIDNGGGVTVDCFAQITFTVNNWPPLSCSGGITGNGNPIPALPDNMLRSYTYTANVSGLAGRTATYVWTMGSGNLVSQTGNQAVIRWDAADSSAAPGTPDTFSVSITVTNPDGTVVGTNCGSNRTVNVQVPRLTCAAPIGDLTPVNGETNTYTTSITNQYGRTLGAVNWTLEIFNTGTLAWDFVTSSTGTTFSHTAFVPGEQYRLSYATSVTNPSDNCVSAYQTLNVTGSGVNFQCDAFPTAGNNFAPNSAAASYTYNVDMDNGNLIPLHYTWVLVGPGVAERVLGTSTSSGNGIVAGAALSGASMGPVGNYTLRVDVRAVNNSDNTQPDYSNYTCSLSHAIVVGTLNVSYTYAAFGGGAINASAVAVGQQICFTNTSDTTHLPSEISRLTYVWNIGGMAANNNFNSNAVSAEQLPACMIFSQPGSYTVNLVGTNDYQGDASFMRTGNYSVTFTVYGLQSIAINRSTQVFAPATMNFQAVGVNITSGYTWTFYRIGNPTPLGTATGANVNRFFGTPGDYRAVVSGSGPLGTTTGQVDFTLLNASQIRAAFTPSQYGGVATMHVCFTDQSVGTPITTWSWDFGNGQTLNYTNSNIPASICTDYTTASTSYPVTLTISNGSVTETATNVVRTYSLLESSASFSITPNGAAQYCFTASISGSTAVTGWDFGDGSTGAAQNNICHTYAASGSYVVHMNIVNTTTGETGSVVRVVNVNLGGGAAPSLAVVGNCSPQRTATFRITNSGGDMTTPDQVTIRDLNNNIVLIEAFTLTSGSYRDFIVTNMSGAVTMTTTDTALTASTNCEYPPAITVVASCANGLPVFTVSNSDGPMIAPQTYEIRDSSNTVVASGSFQLARGDAPVSFTAPTGSNPYETYTFVSSGAVGNFNMPHNCNSQPSLTIVRACQTTASFTITNTGGSMFSAQTFTITDANSVDVTPAQNSFQLANGQSMTIVLTGLDPYADYTLSTTGFAGTVSGNGNCQEPTLSVTYVCDVTPYFVVSNTGSDMLAAQSYSISQGVTPISSGTFQIASGASTNIVIPSVADATQGVNFTTNQFGVSASGQMSCEPTAIAALSALSSNGTTPTPLGGGIDGVNYPDWANVPTCGHNCPTFRLYHTDETGDWEIFRLDGANEETQESFRRNLSLGEGEGVNDMAPSLSPNDEYIVFTSNRATEPGQAENWEIYVASTSGDPNSVQRVTYNTFATDTDPVWGPNNYVVYETTRNGNWDLYMVDMSTGQEYQVTDSPADDINPYWSPDGSKLVFQSDRDGNGWQIFELDLVSRSTKLLSDGTHIDVDPQYSSDGSQILYRSYTSEEDNSVLTIMNADGTEARTITTPDEDATNGVWSPSGRYIAYQSDLDGDLDIYVTEVATGAMRQLTDNSISDYAPTWLCGDDRVMFTSDITNEPDIFEQDVLPLDAPAVQVEEESDQMTFEPSNDIYPSNSPSEENASREGRTVLGSFGEQTSFLHPAVDVTERNLSLDGAEREDWRTLDSCPIPS
jgi:Tol biopolymer transport system component/PKD repeat protein